MIPAPVPRRADSALEAKTPAAPEPAEEAFDRYAAAASAAEEAVTVAARTVPLRSRNGVSIADWELAAALLRQASDACSAAGQTLRAAVERDAASARRRSSVARSIRDWVLERSLGQTRKR